MNPMPNAPIRSASLLSEPASIGWWLGIAASLLPLAAAATTLALRWQRIPARFPIHWGIDGQPNRWVGRDPASVFGLLALAAALILLLGVIGQLIARSSPGHTGRFATIRTANGVVLGAAWLIALLFSGLSLLPLAHNPTRLVPLLLIATFLFLAMLIVVAVLRASRLRAENVAARNSTDVRFWKAGLIYFNPSDSAVMVPKRSGLGYTMNFARPVSWLVLGAILALPIALSVALTINRH